MSAAMAVVSLEIKRARQALERFCAERNSALQNTGRFLCCQQQDDALVLAESSGPAASAVPAVSIPLVRLHYRDARWFLYWRTPGGAWAPYPHLPETDNVQRIVDELEQAPLHVHWG